MKKGSSSFVLAREWAAYLQRYDHDVKRTRNGNALSSRNGAGTRFRWLFAHSTDSTLRLTASDHEYLERQARHARQAGERPYLVVKFEQPEPKLLVLPAAKAARTRLLSAKQGGIPWDA